jgi:hypothetical protein
VILSMRLEELEERLELLETKFKTHSHKTGVDPWGGPAVGEPVLKYHKRFKEEIKEVDNRFMEDLKDL